MPKSQETKSSFSHAVGKVPTNKPAGGNCVYADQSDSSVPLVVGENLGGVKSSGLKP